MWPFKSKQDLTGAETADMPEEVQKYYSVEHREHLGLAWLLAFVTLILTVGVIVGLFFSGRWVVHKIAHKNGNTSVAQTTSHTQSTKKPVAKQPVTKTPVTTPQSSQPSASTPQATTPAPVVITPLAGQQLSNTGPGNTIVIFVAVSLLAAIGHNAYQRRRALG